MSASHSSYNKARKEASASSFTQNNARSARSAQAMHHKPSKSGFSKRPSTWAITQVLASVFAVVLAATFILPNASATGAQSTDTTGSADTATSVTLQDLLAASDAQIPVTVNGEAEAQAIFTGGALVDEATLTGGSEDGSFAPTLSFTDPDSMVAQNIDAVDYVGASIRQGSTASVAGVVAAAQVDGQVYYATADDAQAILLDDGDTLVLEYAGGSAANSDANNEGEAAGEGADETSKDVADTAGKEAAGEGDDSPADDSGNGAGDNDANAVEGNAAVGDSLNGARPADEDPTATQTADDNDAGKNTDGLATDEDADSADAVTGDADQQSGAAGQQSGAEDAELTELVAALTPMTGMGTVSTLSARVVAMASLVTYSVDVSELGNIATDDEIITWELDGKTQSSPEYLMFKGGEISASTVTTPTISNGTAYFSAAYVVINSVRYEIDKLGSIADADGNSGKEFYFHSVGSMDSSLPFALSSSLPEGATVIFSFVTSQYTHNVTSSITGKENEFAGEDYGFVNLPDTVTGGTELVFQFQRAAGMKLTVTIQEGNGKAQSINPSSPGGGSTGRLDTYTYETGDNADTINVIVTVERMNFSSVDIDFYSETAAANVDLSTSGYSIGDFSYQAIKVEGKQVSEKTPTTGDWTDGGKTKTLSYKAENVGLNDTYEIDTLSNTLGQRFAGNDAESREYYEDSVQWLSAIKITHTTATGQEVTESVAFPYLPAEENIVGAKETTTLSLGDAAGTKVTVTVAKLNKVTVARGSARDYKPESVWILDYSISVSGMRVDLEIEAVYRHVVSQDYVVVQSVAGGTLYTYIADNSNAWRVADGGFSYNISNGYTGGLEGKFCYQLADGYVNPVITVNGTQVSSTGDAGVTPHASGPDGYDANDKSWYCFTPTQGNGRFKVVISISATPVSYSVEYAETGVAEKDSDWSGDITWQQGSIPVDNSVYDYNKSVFQISSNLPTSDSGYFRYYQIRVNGKLLDGQYYPGQTVDIMDSLNSDTNWGTDGERTIELVPVFGESATAGDLTAGTLTLKQRQENEEYSETTEQVSLPYGSNVTLTAAQTITEDGDTWELTQVDYEGRSTVFQGGNIGTFTYEKVQTITYKGSREGVEVTLAADQGYAFEDATLVAAEDVPEGFIPDGYTLAGWTTSSTGTGGTEYRYADLANGEIVVKRPWNDLELSPILEEYRLSADNFPAGRNQLADAESISGFLFTQAGVSGVNNGESLTAENLDNLWSVEVTYEDADGTPVTVDLDTETAWAADSYQVKFTLTGSGSDYSVTVTMTVFDHAVTDDQYLIASDDFNASEAEAKDENAGGLTDAELIERGNVTVYSMEALSTPIDSPTIEVDDSDFRNHTNGQDGAVGYGYSYSKAAGVVSGIGVVSTTSTVTIYRGGGTNTGGDEDPTNDVSVFANDVTVGRNESPDQWNYQTLMNVLKVRSGLYASIGGVETNDVVIYINGVELTEQSIGDVDWQLSSQPLTFTVTESGGVSQSAEVTLYVRDVTSPQPGVDDGEGSGGSGDGSENGTSIFIAADNFTVALEDLQQSDNLQDLLFELAGVVGKGLEGLDLTAVDVAITANGQDIAAGIDWATGDYQVTFTVNGYETASVTVTMSVYEETQGGGETGEEGGTGTGDEGTGTDEESTGGEIGDGTDDSDGTGEGTGSSDATGTGESNDGSGTGDGDTLARTGVMLPGDLWAIVLLIAVLAASGLFLVSRSRNEAEEQEGTR